MIKCLAQIKHKFRRKITIFLVQRKHEYFTLVYKLKKKENSHRWGTMKEEKNNIHFVTMLKKLILIVTYVQYKNWSIYLI